MSQQRTIERGRRFANRLLNSTCTITRVVGKRANPETITNEDEVVVVYQGPCKIRIAAAAAGIQEREPIGQQIAASQKVLSLPVADSTVGVRKNDMVVITANLSDPALVGSKFRVKAKANGTDTTARRYQVEEQE